MSKLSLLARNIGDNWFEISNILNTIESGKCTNPMLLRSELKEVEESTKDFMKKLIKKPHKKYEKTHNN